MAVTVSQCVECLNFLEKARNAYHCEKGIRLSYFLRSRVLPSPLPLPYRYRAEDSRWVLGSEFTVSEHHDTRQGVAFRFQDPGCKLTITGSLTFCLRFALTTDTPSGNQLFSRGQISGIPRIGCEI